MGTFLNYFELSRSTLTALLVVLALTILGFKHHRHGASRRPPSLSETIPFVSNALQFMTNKRVFINRVRNALQVSPVVQCWLGPMKLNLIAGERNISILFRSSCTSDPWILRIIEHSAGYLPSDVAKFEKDTSGGTSLPRGGSTATVSEEQRIWHAMHRLYDETLLSPESVHGFAKIFQGFFSQRLEKAPVGTWIEGVRVFDFLKLNVTDAATQAVLGSRMIDVNSDIANAFWDYEKFVESLAFGLPNWLSRRGVYARDRLRDMCLRWYDLANKEYDWDSVDQHLDADWEPIFGSQISRGLARWSKSFNFSPKTIGAVYSLFLFGLHANTIPVSTWIVFELMKDPDLFRAIKEEIAQAETTDNSGAKSLDYKKLSSLPLLQSTYTEALRVHVGVLITRTNTEPVTIAGYNFPTGSVFQASTEVAHLNEAVWGVPDHPASEFWAYRHVKEVGTVTDSSGHLTKKLEFSLRGRAGSFFPYGGGISMCAGRNLAKPEVLLATAMIVSRFEVEIIRWLKPDGSESDRPALDNKEYANAVASPPDRELEVRWRRTW